ncbi:MAG: PHP-associated domain-containing protein [Candidatus Bathyarchaeia archaeon]|nr:PHP domain-containing protein [Candidatus Bathyarchaeota archaeon]
MNLKIDLHVHTINSKDSYISLKHLSKIVLLKKIDGVAITDHNFLTKIKFKEVLVIPGVEVSTKEGHLIGLGVETYIKKGLSAIETAEKIHEEGGLVIAPHPYDFISSSLNPFKLQRKLDAIETVNASVLTFKLSKMLAEKAALKLNLPKVAGSDAHIPEAIGDAYTIIKTSSINIEDVLKAIKNGETQCYGKSTSIKNRVKKITLDVKKRIL